MPNYVQQNGIQSTFLRLNPKNGAVYSIVGISDTLAMSTESAALAAMTVVAPSLAPEAVASAVESQFGLVGEFSPLVSERDQNFLLRSVGGDKYVAKVTSASEKATATDFQIAGLLYLGRDAELLVPKVYRTLAGDAIGEIGDESGLYRLRVVTWVSGDPLESLPLDTAACQKLGAALAHLDYAFTGFSHPGENQVLLWDLQRVVALRELIENISDSPLLGRVECAIDDFEKSVLPVIGNLRAQVIHADANPGNILLADGAIGFIDFSDIVRAPLVFDVAIAASYLRSFEADPLQFVVPFVEAYHARMPLNSQEADLLFDLVRARLATTVTLLYWRLSARAEDDPYRQKTLETEAGAERYLELLDSLGRTKFRQKLSFIQ